MNDYYNGLNKVIERIEENLTKKIDYKELAKIVGTSDYTLQRIFCFLTGVTLTEYIRKRRLSNAAEELQRKNEKVIDIAIKYQYDSPVSFSRAFKKMHGINPNGVKNKKATIKSFPKIEFKQVEEYTQELEYRIVSLSEQVFYGKATKTIYSEDKISIANLWKECEKDGTLEYIISNSKGQEKYYGASLESFENEEHGGKRKIKYCIMGKEKREDLSKIVIPKATWACFRLTSKQQKDILKLIDQIYTKWLPSSKYNEVLSYPNLEIYYNDYCEYCIAVK